MAKRLTTEGEELQEEFQSRYADRGCTCFVSPPCSYCTHPGNPLCIEESPDLWEDDPDTEIDWLSLNKEFANG